MYYYKKERMRQFILAGVQEKPRREQHARVHVCVCVCVVNKCCVRAYVRTSGQGRERVGGRAEAREESVARVVTVSFIAAAPSWRRPPVYHSCSSRDSVV